MVKPANSANNSKSGTGQSAEQAKSATTSTTEEQDAKDTESSTSSRVSHLNLRSRSVPKSTRRRAQRSRQEQDDTESHDSGKTGDSAESETPMQSIDTAVKMQKCSHCVRVMPQQHLDRDGICPFCVLDYERQGFEATVQRLQAAVIAGDAYMFTDRTGHYRPCVVLKQNSPNQVLVRSDNNEYWIVGLARLTDYDETTIGHRDGLVVNDCMIQQISEMHAQGIIAHSANSPTNDSVAELRTDMYSGFQTMSSAVTKMANHQASGQQATVKNDGDGSYTKRLFERNILTTFRQGKWPTDSTTFYSYVAKVYQFVTDNADLSKTMVWRSIYDAAPEEHRNAFVASLRNEIPDKWNQHCVDQNISESASNYNDLRDAFVERHMATNKNVDNWLRFIRQNHTIFVNGEEIHDKLFLVAPGLCERPDDTLNRLRSYFEQINRLASLFNAELDIPIKKVTESEKLTVLHRCFDRNNNSAQYGNQHSLNQKVQSKYKTFLHQNPQAKLAAFEQKIKSFVSSITLNEPQESWAAPRKSASNLFLLRPHNVVTNTSTNWNNNVGKTGSGSKTSSRKRSFKQMNYTNPSPPSFTPNSKRRKRYRGRVEQPRRTVQFSRNNDRNYSQNGNGYQSRPFSSNINTQYNNQAGSNVCQFGAKCFKWQKGTCTKSHPGTIVCSHCGIIGHAEYQCRRKNRTAPNQNSGQQEFKRYNPKNQPNNSAARRNIQSSKFKKNYSMQAQNFRTPDANQLQLEADCRSQAKYIRHLESLQNKMADMHHMTAQVNSPPHAAAQSACNIVKSEGQAQYPRQQQLPFWA